MAGYFNICYFWTPQKSEAMDMNLKNICPLCLAVMALF